MKYDCTLRTSVPVSHLATLEVVESEAFHTTGISRQDVNSLALSFSNWKRIDGLFYTSLHPRLAPPALSYLCPPQATLGHAHSSRNPHLLNLQKTRPAFIHPLLLLIVDPKSVGFSSSLHSFKCTVLTHAHLWSLLDVPILSHSIPSVVFLCYFSFPRVCPFVGCV